jgi:hypothetical protein
MVPRAEVYRGQKQSPQPQTRAGSFNCRQPRTSRRMLTTNTKITAVGWFTGPSKEQPCEPKPRPQGQDDRRVPRGTELT